MLYAKPSLNAKGCVRFGMKQIHAFNRYPDCNNPEHVIHVMQYVFPRQFNLRNIFSPAVDPNKTAQSSKDYTIREGERATLKIKKKPSSLWQSVGHTGHQLPSKRLRGSARALVHKILRNHRSCAYAQLLRHYCPNPDVDLKHQYFNSSSMFQTTSMTSSRLVSQPSGVRPVVAISTSRPSASSPSEDRSSILDYPTPAAKVSAFCQAIVQKLLPEDTFGVGVDGKENSKRVMLFIDRFVCMGKYESLTLHEVSQGIKLGCISWLRPEKLSITQKMSISDRRKRIEILLELMYYLFDSILIPLIRTNFYVTESNMNRNQLFYFRQDIWRRLSEPSLTVLKMRMLEEMKPEAARRLLNSRSLGFSHVRLLPKMRGSRPIINLRRKTMKPHNGGTSLGISINDQLAPVFHMLNYERCYQPKALGSALFSIGDLHGRLRDFKMTSFPLQVRALYFVKVDVQACFDTIPQANLLALVEKLISHGHYRIGKHAEIKPGDERWMANGPKTTRRFVGAAYPVDSAAPFSETKARRSAYAKRATLFTDTGNQKIWGTKQLFALLREHVQRNVIKIDKKHFRQKKGIPQGSVLSSLLCSLFYGSFEQDHLGFLEDGESLLCRLIDDFLLITTNQSHARLFMQVMADGSAEHGISINTAKSLANFEMNVNGSKVPRNHGSSWFPYCGMSIDTRTLEVRKDREKKGTRPSYTMTVELSRKVGQTFHRRVLASLKIQMHAMILDTSLNTPGQVISTLYGIFTETAVKMNLYMKSLPGRKRPGSALVVETIQDLMKLAVNLTSGKKSTKTISEYECCVSPKQIQWLAAAAFEEVLRQKQSAYSKVLCWLRELTRDDHTGVKLHGKMGLRLPGK